MAQVKTSELTGAALDWAVAQCDEASVSYENIRFGGKALGMIYDHPNGYSEKHSPSSNWSQGGPIIEREISKVFRNVGGTWSAMILRNDPIPYDERGTSLALTQRVQFNKAGNTPLIAAMRCYVASKMGEVVDVPGELA